jgi:hypothetical protein
LFEVNRVEFLFFFFGFLGILVGVILGFFFAGVVYGVGVYGVGED